MARVSDQPYTSGKANGERKPRLNQRLGKTYEHSPQMASAQLYKSLADASKVLKLKRRTTAHANINSNTSCTCRTLVNR